MTNSNANTVNKAPVKLSLVQSEPLAKASNQKSSTNSKINIAFATTNNEVVDQHFGSASQFAIYQLDKHSWQLISLIEFAAGKKGHDDKKLNTRIGVLKKCQAIYCNAIGASAIKQLLPLKVKPITVDNTTNIRHVLSELVTELKANDNHWLIKQSKASEVKTGATDNSKTSTERLSDLLSEDWEY